MAKLGVLYKIQTSLHRPLILSSAPFTTITFFQTGYGLLSLSTQLKSHNNCTNRAKIELFPRDFFTKRLVCKASIRITNKTKTWLMSVHCAPVENSANKLRTIQLLQRVSCPLICGCSAWCFYPFSVQFQIKD